MYKHINSFNGKLSIHMYVFLYTCGISVVLKSNITEREYFFFVNCYLKGARESAPLYLNMYRAPKRKRLTAFAKCYNTGF